VIDLDAAGLSSQETYRLLTCTVTPRPIAWVSTLNAAGDVNLAPFSCYTYISPDPPLVVIAVGGRAARKDTLNNVQRTGEFTINTVDRTLSRPMVESSRRYPADLSEAADLGIAMAPGCKVKVPRVAASLVSLECVMHRVLEVGDAHHHSLLLGRVVCFRLADQIWTGEGIDMTAFQALGRLGGVLYSRPGEIERIEPTPDERFSRGA
jgi:flavin reductase (DIM6/NTAB) family NADH-FMN oxidoreductase RutF